MFPDEQLRMIGLIIAGVLGGVALAIVLLGWLAGRLFPRARFVAPFAIAAFACLCAAVEITDDRLLFVVPWMLAAAAVALYRLLRESLVRRRRAGAAPLPGTGEQRPAEDPDARG